MIYQEIPVLAEGSSPEAGLVVYIQDYSTEMLVQERPLVLLCPGGGYDICPCVRRKVKHCSFRPWVTMRRC
ncbi:MAG: hypothetical protein ACI4TA_10420 [Acetatifactor sp.]